MISIAICADVKTVLDIKEKIQEFLISSNTFAKMTLLNDVCKLLRIPGSYDIYIIDMDSNSEEAVELGYQMSQIDPHSKIIMICSKKEYAYKAAQIYAHYFLLKPVSKEDLSEVLDKIKTNIQETNIIVRTSEGDKRVKINNINYINIVDRCLCYHLTDGNVYDGYSLRSSFKKAINPLQMHRSFVFLHPSLLININHVKILNKDHLTFENDEVIYFPRKHYEMIYERWKEESRVIME